MFTGIRGGLARVAVNWNTVKQGISFDNISRVLSESSVIFVLDSSCLHNLKVFYIQGPANTLFSQWRLVRNEGTVDGSLGVFNFLSHYFLNFCTRLEKSR